MLNLRVLLAVFFATAAVNVSAGDTSMTKNPPVTTPVVEAVAPSPQPTEYVQPAIRNATAAQIAQINENIALLSARLAELELLAKIDQKQAEIKRGVAAPAASNAGASSMGSASALNAPLASLPMVMPTVTDISGVDNRLKATLYSDGGFQVVRVGDRVGDWRVKSIKMDEVVVAKGKQLRRLSFGASQGSNLLSGLPSSGSPSGMPPMPGMPR